MKLRAVFVGMLPPQSGGAAISLSMIVTSLAAAGHEICAVTPITSADLDHVGDWFAARHPALRVVRYLLPDYRFEPYKPRAAKAATQEDHLVRQLVCELVASFRPELLIAGHETYGAVVGAAARESGLPWCLWLRGSPTAQILAGTFPEDRTRAILDVYRSADRIIAVAPYMVRGLAERFGLAGIRCIPNAVDLGRFFPRPPASELRVELGIPALARIVLVPASLIARKRPEDVLAAAASVVQQRDDTIFVFAGEGTMAEKVKLLANRLGLVRRTRFLGWVAPERMPGLYALADLVVMATEAEGMSRVYLETLASGRVIVASDIPAARDLITDGENGFLFRLGDVKQLAERILGLMEDDPARSEIGARARLSVAERSQERVTARYAQELGDLARSGDQAATW